MVELFEYIIVKEEIILWLETEDEDEVEEDEEAEDQDKSVLLKEIYHWRKLTTIVGVFQRWRE